MSWDTDLMEVLKTSSENAYERIIHLSAQQKVYSDDSDLQWFSELLEQHGGISVAKIISALASAEKLASMSLQVKELAGLTDSDRLPRKLTRVRIPLLTGIRVMLPGKTPDVHDVEEESVKVVEEAAPPVAQEPVRQAPKTRRSVKKSPEVTQKVIPPPEEKPKPVEPAKSAPETRDPLVPPPKPLKVIRRRRAEEPKIFETAPKSFPRAMLEGIKLTPEEKGEKPLD